MSRLAFTLAWALLFMWGGVAVAWAGQRTSLSLLAFPLLLCAVWCLALAAREEARQALRTPRR